MHCYKTTDTVAFIHVVSYDTKKEGIALERLKHDGHWTRRDYWLITSDRIEAYKLEGSVADKLFPEAA